jgi:hypothetical protein
MSLPTVLIFRAGAGFSGLALASMLDRTSVRQIHRRLAQALIFGVHCLHLGQVEHGPQQHRSVPI